MANYRKYKPYLREEFSNQCVYCRALEQIKGPESFGVDHYRPKSLFPQLENEYLNLYLACNRCNSLKGSYWPSGRDEKLGRFVPNPCEHVMFDHMRFVAGTIHGHSIAGQLAVERLDLNDPSAVALRKALDATLDEIDSSIVDGRRQIRSAEKALSKELDPQRRVEIEGLIVELKDNELKYQEQWAGLVGTEWKLS